MGKFTTIFHIRLRHHYHGTYCLHVHLFYVCISILPILMIFIVKAFYKMLYIFFLFLSSAGFISGG